MISVILPTLWKIEFEEQLIKLHESSIVGEILLINNDKLNTPGWFNPEKFIKLKEIIPNKNIFVNPAWNIGVKISKHEHIMLHSDDVVSNNYNFLEEINLELINDDCLIGIDRSCYNITSSSNKSIDTIKFNDISNSSRDIGFGCMMFFRKTSYKPIPNEYLIWRGDDFMIDRYKHMNKKIKTITNLSLAETRMSVTADLPEFSWKEAKEGSNDKYNTCLKEYLK
jgi:hypothetical protein